MKKFLSNILAICFAFTIGMTFACSAPEFTVEYTYSDFGVATCPNI